MNSRKSYNYRAIDSKGNIVRGTALAINSVALYQQLLDRNIHLISSRLQFSFTKAKSINTQDMLDFCLHMQYMDQAGVPLLDALEDAKASSINLQPILDEMISSIKSGKLFSQAMAEHSSVFPPMFTQIIYLAEQSGKLSEGVQKIYQHLSWVHQNKHEISKSLRYPAIVLTLICGVLWMMSSIVIPQMHELLTMSGTEIPESSKLILKINQAFMTCAPGVFIGLVIMTLLMLGLRQISMGQKLMQDKLILKLPGVGTLIQKRDVTLFLHFFQVCLSSHVDLLESLDYSKKAIRNLWLREKISLCATRIKDGATLSHAMQSLQIFSPSTIRMVQVGEVTGQLIPLLAILESYQSRDLKRQIERIMAYLQPIMFGIIGLILIWIVLGIFYPMYDQLFVLEG